jgi:hypothetical protein
MALSLNEKVKVIEAKEKDKHSVREIMMRFKCGKTQVSTHEQAFHCVSEVMQFATDSNSSSLLEVLYTVKDCIQKDMSAKKWKQVSLLGLWKKSQ